ncbi:MAG: VOC family protein [Chloroflexi bacterium]|nr:VOC family protein [Chloroflexota bacterium]
MSKPRAMGQFDHVAFQVGDMDAAIAFYVEKLGFSLLSRNVNAAEQEEYSFLTLGDVRLELLRHTGEEYTRPQLKAPYCPHLALETDDMPGVLARLQAAGVSLLRGPLEIPGEETWVYFADPDHNVLEYIQWYKKK